MPSYETCQDIKLKSKYWLAEIFEVVPNSALILSLVMCHE